MYETGERIDISIYEKYIKDSRQYKLWHGTYSWVQRRCNTLHNCVKSLCDKTALFVIIRENTPFVVPWMVYTMVRRHGNALSWWRHQMETFSALLALCAGNSPVPVNSPHKGQWRGALMFSLICARINDWVNNREAGDLRRHHDHHDVNVMMTGSLYGQSTYRRCISLRKDHQCGSMVPLVVFYI